MAQKILYLGAHAQGAVLLETQLMKEKYGNDIIIVTPEEAEEQGLTAKDFVNMPTMKITAPPTTILPTSQIYGHERSGKEKRRKRREQERSFNKFKKNGN